jgi:transposase InsO family protein
LEDAHTEIFEYIEMYYNTQRRHSALDYPSTLDYEKQYFYSLTLGKSVVREKRDTSVRRNSVECP